MASDERGGVVISAMPTKCVEESGHMDVRVQALLGRLTYCLIGQADLCDRFEGLLHIKRFTGGYNHPGYTCQLVSQSYHAFVKTLSVNNRLSVMGVPSVHG